MAMIVGLSSYSFPWAVGIPGFEPEQPLTVMALLERAIAWDVSALQFSDNLPLHTLPADEWQALRAKAAAHTIQLEVGMRGLTPANLKTYVRLAWEARSPFLRVVIDDGDFRPTVDDVIAIINEKLPSLRGAGVILAIENHDRFSGSDLARIARQTDRNWVGFCVDTTNSFGAGESATDVLNALAQIQVVNFHLKDFRASRVEHKMGFHIEGCEPGTGLLNVRVLLVDRKTYRLNNRNLPVTLTLEQWPPFKNTLAETIEMELAWAETGIQWINEVLKSI